MKHEPNIAPASRKKWRLKKTLARRPQIRPIMAEDLKFLWASYKKGALSSMGGAFANGDMSPEQFSQAFENAAQNYSEGWVIIADTRKGSIPAGLVLGKMDSLFPFMVIVGVAWFPWATKRNVIEGTVAFFDVIRKTMPSIVFAVAEHKRVYEVCCMHGIMRRVGTSQIAIPERAAAVFETRS